jgi:ketosteroid isomerase-like protein
MPQENVERLDRIFEHLFEGRRLGPELLADDAEWVNPPDAVEGGTRKGADAFNDAIESVFAAWDDVWFDTDRVVENGDDQVVALGVLRGHIRGPGMQVESPHGQVWTFRAGRVARMQWFNTHEETLQAAGLPPRRP